MKPIVSATLLLAFGAALFAEEDLTVLTETPDGMAPGKQL